MTEIDDTSATAQETLLELYRNMEPGRKLRLLFEHQAAVDAVALAGIRLRHPRATERELTLRLAALRYPRELMVQVFGWDPEVQGY